jgi:hypothetical protein
MGEHPIFSGLRGRKHTERSPMTQRRTYPKRPPTPPPPRANQRLPKERRVQEHVGSDAGIDSVMSRESLIDTVSRALRESWPVEDVVAINFHFVLAEQKNGRRVRR